MMKKGADTRKCTFILVAFITCTAGLSAIPVSDVINTVNGASYRGIIVERVPYESYTIREPNGDSTSIPTSEITNIAKIYDDKQDGGIIYRDVVLLKSGILFKGTIVAEEINTYIVLETDPGIAIEIAMEEVWKIGKEERRAVVSPTAEWEDPAVTGMKNSFSISLSIAQLEKREEGEQGDGQLDSLRDDIEALQTKQESLEAAAAKREGHIADLSNEIVALEESSYRVSAELAKRAIACSVDYPDLVEQVRSLYAQNLAISESLSNLAAANIMVDPLLVANVKKAESEIASSDLSYLVRSFDNDPVVVEAIETLVPRVPLDKREWLYEDAKIKRVDTAVLRNALLPIGIGSFRQGDAIGGMISGSTMLVGSVVALNGTARYLQFGDLSAISISGWIGLGTMAGSYVFSIVRPIWYAAVQNARLRSALSIGTSE